MSEEGGEDSPPRPKRKIKKVMVLSSDSSSDSDESVTAAGTRRKRLRVLSDEGSDSSGSSVVCVGARRKRALPKLRDSDGDSDTSGWATDHSDAPKPATSSLKKQTSGFASDSSEGNSDKCSICLLRFTDQEVGTPQSCEHIFCLDCITEWSKNVNTCPVDRMTFDFIVVRACAGGRVLRTEPVKVVERRPSVEMLVIEDPTVCEVCGRTDNEETMLLCDGCDLGYHMQCLTPPLSEVPIDQWLCPNCDNLLSDVDYLFSGITDMDMDVSLSSRSASIREGRNVRLSRSHSAVDEPSTSSGRRGNNLNSEDLPTTSRGSRTTHSTSLRTATTRRKTTTHTNRRRLKRRRTKTVVIEYEVQENGKFPVTKQVKRKLKKRKIKRRQPRTAARRSHVRASVRAKLAAVGAERLGPAQLGGTAAGVHELGVRRRRAGIPSLSLFGDPHQIEYFSEEDEHGISESASTAVAVRPTSSILSAYRQARRKMISVPSPPHASSAPDVLSSILESQALLHSKKSVVSISVDGSVNIKLETREKTKLPKNQSEEPKHQEKIDLSKGEDAAKKVPSYPGQSRGGRGWGGGYTGNYHREQGTNNLNNRGSNYENNYNSGGFQNRQGNSFHQNNNTRRDDADTYNNYSRRPHQYQQGDDLNFDQIRNRRQAAEQNRTTNNQHPNQRHNEQGRYSMGPSPWQPYVPPPVGPRNDPPPVQHRHSFGGFENPLDMRVGQMQRQNSANSNPNTLSSIQAQRTPKLQASPFTPLPEPPMPPMFKFDQTPEVEKSEDEKSDSSLVIDTEKYDPTEPTNDDDSGDDDDTSETPAAGDTPAPPSPPPASAPAVQDILAGIDTSGMNVPHNILDSAVRQVLQEHRNLIAPAAAQSRASGSDDDSEGDCPNFSIYSATSVHIANNTTELPQPPREAPRDNMEDLVQEDDDLPDEPPPKPEPTPAPAPVRYSHDNILKKKSEEELKEKVSKRCPITTNPRNPIKIKLNTPSLIKRQVSLYDEEEQEEEMEEVKVEDSEPVPVEHAADTHENKQVGIENESPTPSDAALDKEKIFPDIALNTDTVVQPDTNHEEPDEIQEEDKSIKSATQIENDDVTPDIKDEPATLSDKEATKKLTDDKLEHDDETMESIDRAATPLRDHKGGHDSSSDDDNDDLSDTEENELPLGDPSSRKGSVERNDDLLEKMTESISETEDERSYTPCLDENKSKDTSMETEKEKGIEGLDTEMISEDEGNEMFSDTERAQSEQSHASPAKPLIDGEEGEILDKKKEPRIEEGKKKKKKESKKEGKDKNKGKNKKNEVAFKKLSKSGKERNYRDKDKKRERRDSSDGERERAKQRRKERRKDLERYDVRTVVSEKRRRPKDAFGRDVSPRARSRSPSRSHSPPRLTPARRASSPPARRRSSSRARPSASPRARRSASPRARRSASPRARRSASPRARRSASPRARRSASLRARRSASPRARRSASPRARRSASPPARRRSGSRPRVTPPRARRSVSRMRSSPAARARHASSSPRRTRPSPSPRSASPRVASPTRVTRRRRRSMEREKRAESRRRRSAVERSRKRRRSGSGSKSPRPKATKRKKRARSERSGSRRRSPRRRSIRRRRARRRSISRTPDASPVVEVAAPEAAGERSPGSVDSRLLSPRTPPPEAPPDEKRERRRRDPERARHRRLRDAAGPSKEVFTSGDNILVSVSFKEQERAEGDERRERRRERRRRRRRAPAPEADATAPRPVAIIDLERSPFRELTPSPRNVIVLSDSEPGEKEPEHAGAVPAPSPPHSALGPQTPPSPGSRAPAPAPEAGAEDARGPNTPPEPPDSPDAYDPYEPTRSASGSPGSARAASPPRPMMTLETAQKTNMSADEVIDRRPLSPIEKVMALLQSTRDVSPENPPPGDAASCGAPPEVPPAPAAAAPAPPAPAPAAPPAPAPPVRIVLPSPTRSQPPKLFLAKPSPIKSDPIKPMQAAKLPRPGAQVAARRREESEAEADSPYSPGSSDFGDLFEPPGAGARASFDALLERPQRTRKQRSAAAKVPVKLNKKKGKMQVGVKIDEDNLKILDDLPSSAVEMQVKSKFLKKLNRQERVVEEVKLVLKPHYNKKHVTKDEYKDILRRAVPKICHNKTGEINPAKIQALVEAYVKKFRKKHKLGLV